MVVVPHPTSFGYIISRASNQSSGARGPSPLWPRRLELRTPIIEA